MTRYSEPPVESLNTGKGAVVGQNWRSLWSLDPKITFLNHGSFGACPLAVLERQWVLRSQMEQEPVRFFALELEPLLDAARQDLATFLKADAADLAFVPNATTGVNTVLRSLCISNPDRASLQPGDELLTTNHEYNACRNALDFTAQITGAKVVVAEVPFPIEAPDEAIAVVLNQVSPRTRLVLLDHVTSQTGLIFPLQSLIRQLTDRGIEVLVDGAHAPGMIDLNLKALGATYYTGNCHKWLCAPKGAAFLYVQADRHSHLRPLTISHGANSPRIDRSRFRLEFDWTGTADPTPYLCIPDAIQFMGSLLPGGWDALRQYNRATVLTARAGLCKALDVAPPCPDSMIGSMAVVPLPDGSAEHLQASLFQRHLEVPIIPWQGSVNRLIRVSAQIYNTPADYDVLTEAVLLLIKEEKGI
ncbi:MAG: aminotransferase class V-fold PLP-dependent enzyme [Drouetiella hepatica Uher 2000/2452]|jgi:isopenicillin-N epimerase|uniref:Aminotransferase class V-fold PLP-dependent enzyme n=1 Tax=Drouetiella hepatica Uher 2000/2452 TaxID=904376 RepID=A0A951Q6P5_9CYAN|nr:aminotransferase class V-fold PLP-dependent enzyme [Drouetiella hepatica Uher 2000/2452]